MVAFGITSYKWLVVGAASANKFYLHDANIFITASIFSLVKTIFLMTRELETSLSVPVSVCKTFAVNDCLVMCLLKEAEEIMQMCTELFVLR